MKTKKETIATLSEALGTSFAKHIFTHRNGSTLEVELIPGGLIEIAHFQDMVDNRDQPNAVQEIVKKFINLVFNRRTDGLITKSDIESFFEMDTPQTIFEYMSMMISGVVPDPK